MEINDQHLPDLDKVSLLAATILLAYTLTNFLSLPINQIEIRLAGIYVSIPLSFSVMVAILLGGITASGSAWLLQDHPKLDRSQTTVQHWLLPSLTSWVLWIAIDQLPFGRQWWIAASISGLLLMLILIGEYIVLDYGNPYYLTASIGITAISLALFLILAISLHLAGVRLFFRVPALSISAGLVLLRVIHLRTEGEWMIRRAILAAVVIGEIAAALHYWPLNSISFGVALLGPTYAFIELSENLHKSEKKSLMEIILGPLFVLIFAWAIAWFV